MPVNEMELVLWQTVFINSIHTWAKLLSQSNNKDNRLIGDNVLAAGDTIWSQIESVSEEGGDLAEKIEMYCAKFSAPPIARA